MNVLDRIENMGLKVTWKLITLGLYGFNGNVGLLSRDELFDYLMDCLGRNDGQTDNIIRLICDKTDYSKIDCMLNSFASKDKSIESVQYRKWRAYVLKNLLNDAENHDFLQGLLALMEFWTFDGCLEDCPHEFPDNVGMSVQEYFTEAKYQALLKKNSIWLENEVLYITQLEHGLDCL